jgi:PadR family transcriptional regulator, regulatory protein PadR
MRNMDLPVSTKASLLQALIRGEGYGLELIDRVKEMTAGKLVLSQGNAYPALRDMEREGYVKSYHSEPLPERGGRSRVYYRITAAGVCAAAEQKKMVWGLFRDVPVGGT